MNKKDALKEIKLAKKEKRRANLCDANLYGANLCDADLRDANLCGADLCGANLCDADLRGADLRGANLRGANLRYANLRDANLCGADLCDANLCGADLCDANLRGANLRYANLRGADLRGANLRYANLRGADLCDANLRGANLRYANLRGANNIPEYVYAITNILPEGVIVGYKKCRDKKIVKIRIEAYTPRSCATSRKCRTKTSKVMSITSIDGKKSYKTAISKHDKNFIYHDGEIITVGDDWEEDRWIECGGGIHFFITRYEAVNY